MKTTEAVFFHIKIGKEIRRTITKFFNTYKCASCNNTTFYLDEDYLAYKEMYSCEKCHSALEENTVLPPEFIVPSPWEGMGMGC